MSYPGFEQTLRRVITGDLADGRSTVIIDGGPSAMIGDPGLGGLFEIWTDSVGDGLAPRDQSDQGPARSVLSPEKGMVKVRWFIVEPPRGGVPPEALKAGARAGFARFDAADHLTDQDRHPAMHKTQSLDVICLISGSASLVTDDAVTAITPGQIVIQRGTSHAWIAHGGPALFLAVLIDRTLL